MMNKEKEVVSMHNVINDYWNHYNEMKSKDELREKKARIIAENSVPIIWHGRLVDYYKSQVRIITVSQNPHHRAFGDKPHFDMEKVRGISNHKELDQKSMSILTNQFDAYFERNKENSINDSVFSVYEKMINEVNGSYFKNEDFENCALHLDMLSPIATNPVWSKLDTKQKLVLEKSGKKLFEDLLKVLEPDLVITTVNRKSVESVFKLNKNNIIKTYKNNSIKRINVNAVLYSTNDDIEVLYGGYNQRSLRKTFGFASDSEFSEILDDLREKLFR